MKKLIEGFVHSLIPRDTGETGDTDDTDDANGINSCLYRSLVH